MGWGGGEIVTGRAGANVGLAFADEILAGPRFGGAATREGAFVVFFELVVEARLIVFVDRDGVRSLTLVDFACVALWARALPAGERFVAGFKRVDFAFEAAFSDLPVEDRAGSFLPLLANGVLMRKLPRSCDSSLSKSAPKTSGKA